MSKPDDTIGFYKPRDPAVPVKGKKGSGQFENGVPADGAWLPRTPYWHRMVNSGDLVKVEKPKSTAIQKPSKE